MEWEQLISAKRLTESVEPTAEDDRSPFQKDFDRIVFSSAFRRLQDKTQVHLLSPGDYVRTRLTHSLEASSVGRSLGSLVGKDVIDHHEILAERSITFADFGHIVSAAALTHDIGNPPFGHSGEEAVHDWFARDNIEEKILCRLSSEQEKLDFQKFDGNAQGFRILTRLQFKRNGGLRLTCATLAAFTKYPCASHLADSDAQDAASRKSSFFATEQAYFQEVAEETGLLRRDADQAAWARHPLAYLVEAADDICYWVVDLEDGCKLGLVSYEKVKEYLQPIAELTDEKLASYGGEDERVSYLRASAIGALIKKTAKAFIHNETAILGGSFEGSLLDQTDSVGISKEMREFLIKNVYQSTKNLEVEIAGFDVVSGLLEALIFALLHEPDSSLAPNISPKKAKKLCMLVPVEISDDPSENLHRITDYVVGMTDSFAISLFQKIRGTSL